MSEQADVAEVAVVLSDPPLPPEAAIHSWGEKARRILASDWLAAVKAEAWDEGHEAGMQDETDAYWGTDLDGTRNPYRAAQVAPSRVPSEES